MRSRASATAAVFALLAASAFAAAAPARDAFKGTVSAANGAYSGEDGTALIAIGAPALGPTVRHATFKVSGSRCHSTAHCIRLVGSFHGTITVTGPYNPDVGKQFTIAGSGTVNPLGHVEVTGTAHGTGFVAHGRESLQLRLDASRGSVTVTAQSGLVAGFSSP